MFSNKASDGLPIALRNEKVTFPGVHTWPSVAETFSLKKWRKSAAAKTTKTPRARSLKLFVQLKKIMLVCSEPSNELEEHLLAAGCWITKTNSGRAAVLQARRKNFDAVVLVSTGRDMDLAETAFTLRDVSPSVQIIIMVDPKVSEDCGIPGRSIADAIPDAKALTIAEVGDYLAPPK